MKTFRFESNVVFDAEDMDDAISKVIAHLQSVIDAEESELDYRGSFSVAPDWNTVFDLSDDLPI
jgi:hypothetical protein